jgi:hypothetical protein
MGFMRRHRVTEEERVAKKFADLLSDIRLDLDKVGLYFAQMVPTVTYNRLIIMAEAAEAEKENDGAI